MEAAQQTNLPPSHAEYRNKMAAWFQEQEAVIESDKRDMAFAEASADHFARKALSCRAQAESNREQLRADEARVQYAREEYQKYLNDFDNVHESQAQEANNGGNQSGN